MCSGGPVWGSRVCFLFGGRGSLSRPEPRAAAFTKRSASLRRPALAVGRGFVARGRRRGAFLRLLQSKADARRLTRASRRGFAHSRLGCRSKRCVCCLQRWCPPRGDLWLSLICASDALDSTSPWAPQASLALVVDAVFDRLAPRELPKGTLPCPAKPEGARRFAAIAIYTAV